jgi:hypothetical protein
MAQGMGRVRAVLRGFLVLGLTSSMLVISHPAHACSCAEGDLDRSIRETEGAFVGTYLGRSAIGDYRFAVTFDVERVINGPRAVVRTNEVGGPCGIEPLDGTRIGLLLVRADDGVWESGLCQQVAPDELLAVGEDRPPDPNVAPVSAGWTLASKGLVRVIVVAVLALLVFVVIRWRTPRPGASDVT